MENGDARWAAGQQATEEGTRGNIDYAHTLGVVLSATNCSSRVVRFGIVLVVARRCVFAKPGHVTGRIMVLNKLVGASTLVSVGQILQRYQETDDFLVSEAPDMAWLHTCGDTVAFATVFTSMNRR